MRNMPVQTLSKITGQDYLFSGVREEFDNSINMVNVLSGIFNYSSSVLLLLHTGSTAASTRIPSFGVPFFNRNMIDGHSYLQDVQDTFRPSAMES